MFIKQPKMCMLGRRGLLSSLCERWRGAGLAGLAGCWCLLLGPGIFFWVLLEGHSSLVLLPAWGIPDPQILGDPHQIYRLIRSCQVPHTPARPLAQTSLGSTKSRNEKFGLVWAVWTRGWSLLHKQDVNVSSRNYGEKLRATTSCACVLPRTLQALPQTLQSRVYQRM